MATKKEQVITIKPIVDRTAVIRIVGDTPLIVHKWTEKMKRALPAGARAAELAGITDKKEYQTPMERVLLNPCTGLKASLPSTPRKPLKKL